MTEENGWGKVVEVALLLSSELPFLVFSVPHLSPATWWLWETTKHSGWNLDPFEVNDKTPVYFHGVRIPPKTFSLVGHVFAELLETPLFNLVYLETSGCPSKSDGPGLVWSWRLSSPGPSYYLDGRPPWNTKLWRYKLSSCGQMLGKSNSSKWQDVIEPLHCFWAGRAKREGHLR